MIGLIHSSLSLAIRSLLLQQEHDSDGSIHMVQQHMVSFAHMRVVKITPPDHDDRVLLSSPLPSRRSCFSLQRCAVCIARPRVRH
eukprot:4281299-Amphidinium_carterae.1